MLRRLAISLTTLLAALMVMAPAARAAPAVAVVIDVVGAATPPVRADDELTPGDRIRLAPGAEIILLHLASCEETHIRGGLVDVGRTRLTLSEGAVIVAREQGDCPTSTSGKGGRGGDARGGDGGGADGTTGTGVCRDDAGLPVPCAQADVALGSASGGGGAATGALGGLLGGQSGGGQSSGLSGVLSGGGVGEDAEVAATEPAPPAPEPEPEPAPEPQAAPAPAAAKPAARPGAPRPSADEAEEEVYLKAPEPVMPRPEAETSDDGRVVVRRKKQKSARADAPKPVRPTFPWPPPQPSAVSPIRLPDSLATVGDVSGWIEGALEGVGYFDRSYWAAPGGIALATRLERIRPDGEPAAADDRWPPADLSESFSITGYLASLFYTEPGYFRVIVFVLSDQFEKTSEEEPSAEDAQDWLRRGMPVLPGDLAATPLTGAHRLSALIYEFERAPDSDAVVLAPGRLTGRAHLEKARLMAALGAR